MTNKCKQARENILRLCEILCKDRTNESYSNYVRATIDFKERFKKRFDPHNLVDDYIPDYLLSERYSEYV